MLRERVRPLITGQCGGYQFTCVRVIARGSHWIKHSPQPLQVASCTVGSASLGLMVIAKEGQAVRHNSHTVRGLMHCAASTTGRSPVAKWACGCSAPVGQAAVQMPQALQGAYSICSTGYPSSANNRTPGTQPSTQRRQPSQQWINSASGSAPGGRCGDSTLVGVKVLRDPLINPRSKPRRLTCRCVRYS